MRLPGLPLAACRGLRRGLAAPARDPAAALVQRPASEPAAARGESAVAGHAAQTAAAIRNDARELGGRADAALGRVFGGAATGQSYAPTSPILRQVLESPRPSQPPREPTGRAASPAAAAAAPAPALRSLAELRRLPVAELQRMCAERGVGRPAGAVDKAELAEWAFQHQHLPEARAGGAAAAPSAAPAPAPWSRAELRRMSVAELREQLEARGVGPGAATEKDELVEWVWQHRDLPALRSAPRGAGGGRWTFGRGPGGRPRGPEDARREEEARQEQLEGEGARAQLEGPATPLLEGAAGPAPAAGRGRAWLLAAGAAAAVLAVPAALLVNDWRRSARDEREDR